MAVVKVSIFEKDGEEFDYPREHTLLASEIPIDSSPDFPISAADLLEAISEAIHAGTHTVPSGKTVKIASGKTARPGGICLQGKMEVRGFLKIGG